MHILALCGSLRAASINRTLLLAAARLAPQRMHIELYAGMVNLPLFNPDLEPCPPAQVVELRELVAASDALLIASPEYAHGVSGAIKNALDWLVSFEPFVHKPVAIFNASPRAHHADESLREILQTMSARLCKSASIAIPLLGAGLSAESIVDHPDLSATISASLVQLMGAVAQAPKNGDRILPAR